MWQVRKKKEEALREGEPIEAAALKPVEPVEVTMNWLTALGEDR